MGRVNMVKTSMINPALPHYVMPEFPSCSSSSPFLGVRSRPSLAKQKRQLPDYLIDSSDL